MTSDNSNNTHSILQNCESAFVSQKRKLVHTAHSSYEQRITIKARTTMLRQKIPALQNKHQSGLLSFQHPRACVHAERAQQLRRGFVFGYCGQRRVCVITDKPLRVDWLLLWISLVHWFCCILAQACIHPHVCPGKSNWFHIHKKPAVGSLNGWMGISSLVKTKQIP